MQLSPADRTVLCRELALSLIDHKLVPFTRYGFAYKVLADKLRRIVQQEKKEHGYG